MVHIWFHWWAVDLLIGQMVGLAVSGCCLVPQFLACLVVHGFIWWAVGLLVCMLVGVGLLGLLFVVGVLVHWCFCILVVGVVDLLFVCRLGRGSCYTSV